jgi:hypothetical protein
MDPQPIQADLLDHLDAVAGQVDVAARHRVGELVRFVSSRVIL